MNEENFKRIIELCGSQEDVKKEVYKNHDNNMWWPLDVNDARKRLIIAGLSTRISYNMINTYSKVIKELNEYSYDEIKNMSKDNIIKIIKPLGLSNSRYNYINSMIELIEKCGDRLINASNDEAIEMIVKNVKGASYKVAQCCVLYMKGYYCGIIPVDSRMKDVELPCMGFEKHNGKNENQDLSKQIEKMVNENDFKDIVKKCGYENLNIENQEHPTWLIHLILIYYKRLYCNKHLFKECILSKENLANEKCNRDSK